MKEPMKSGKVPMLRCAGLMVTLAMLTTSCTTSAGSETEATICRELSRELPTYSRRDTAETKAQGVRFLTTYSAVCPN